MTELIAAFCVLVSGILFAWAITATFLAIRFYRAFKCAFAGLTEVGDLIRAVQAQREKSVLSNINEVDSWVN